MKRARSVSFRQRAGTDIVSLPLRLSIELLHGDCLEPPDPPRRLLPRFRPAQGYQLLGRWLFLFQLIEVAVEDVAARGRHEKDVRVGDAPAAGEHAYELGVERFADAVRDAVRQSEDGRRLLLGEVVPPGNVPLGQPVFTSRPSRRRSPRGTRRCPAASC